MQLEFWRLQADVTTLSTPPAVGSMVDGSGFLLEISGLCTAARCCACCVEPSFVLFGTENILSLRGLQQGGFLGPLLLALALHGANVAGFARTTQFQRGCLLFFTLKTARSRSSSLQSTTILLHAITCALKERGRVWKRRSVITLLPRGDQGPWSQTSPPWPSGAAFGSEELPGRSRQGHSLVGHVAHVAVSRPCFGSHALLPGLVSAQLLCGDESAGEIVARHHPTEKCLGSSRL